jgi:pimeloyl-ACP methyl ester carboxylesterase
MADAAAKQALHSIPLIVISRAKPVTLPPNPPAAFSADGFEKAWRAGQDKLAGLLPHTPHVIAENSDHYIQVEQPDLVIDAVRRVVEAVRDPASWPPK